VLWGASQEPPSCCPASPARRHQLLHPAHNPLPRRHQLLPPAHNPLPAGTNFCIRAQALGRVGWFPTYCITEDYALSMELKAAGFKGRWVFLSLFFWGGGERAGGRVSG